jgi:Methyltransferase domain
MTPLQKLAFVADTTRYVLRRPRIKRGVSNVTTEYSDGWNQYWDSLKRCSTLAEWLRIPGVEDRPFHCKVDGKLRRQAFDSSLYYREALRRALGTHFAAARSVTEYGSGLGRNLLYLKRRMPEMQLSGYELCAPGVEIARQAAEKFGLDCEYSQLDYVNEAEARYVLPRADVAFTMFSLEQIPRENRQALLNIHRHVALGSIHVEPVPENYPASYLGLLGRLDHWKVDYLTSFDRNARSIGASRVVHELLASSHNPLMFPSLYVLAK